MPFFWVGRSSFSDAKKLTSSLELALRNFPAKWEKALNDAGDIAQKYLARQFKDQGGEFGSKWAPLAPGTKKQRAKAGYKPSGPILVRRGWLRASVISKTSANAKREVTHRGITLYSTLKTKSGLNLYSLHQKGTKRMPAREIHKEGDPPFISQRGWNEIKTRFVGMFVEIRREMERK